MTHHSLIAALLPAAYREQVLGDLQERGPRARDIVNVVPRIWWSHFRRAWTLPRYALAGVPDAILQQRAQQFLRRSSWLFFLWILVQGQSMIHLINGPLTVDIVIEALLLTLLLVARTVSLSRRLDPLEGAERAKWIAFHRHQLTRHRIWAKLGIPYMLFPMAALSLFQTFLHGATTRTERTAWMVAALAVSLLLGHFRGRQLRREIEGLP